MVVRPKARELILGLADDPTFGTVVENISHLVGSRGNAPHPNVVVQFLIDRRNSSQLVRMYELGCSLGADRIAIGLTWVLLLISMITLVVSGIGIMNIMLATVSARIREIGIRKAMGATNREIRFQFLSEAILISLIGGVLGVIIGLAIPFSVRFFTEYRIPISGLSAIIAIVVSSLVGILFGTLPAIRASQLDPVESLRYE